MRGNILCVVVLLSGCSIGSQWEGRGKPQEPYPDINTVAMTDMCAPPADVPKPDGDDKQHMEEIQERLSAQGRELWRKTFPKQASH